MYRLSAPNPTLSACSVLMELDPASMPPLSSGVMLSFILEALQPLQEKGFSSWLWCAHLAGSCSAWVLRLQPHRDTQLIFMDSFLQYPEVGFPMHHSCEKFSSHFHSVAPFHGGFPQHPRGKPSSEFICMECQWTSSSSEPWLPRLQQGIDLSMVEEGEGQDLI